MQKLLYITPHLSTGGAPQYLLKKIELLKDEYDISLVEYTDVGGTQFVVQKNRIFDIISPEKRITLGEDKTQLLDFLDQVQPDIVHLEEIPELFMDNGVATILYDKSRNYTIFETSHDSSQNPNNKRFFPDKFMFVSNWQIDQYKDVDVPAVLVEYPIEYKENKNREEACKRLGLDPNKKHIVHVGLFTPRKNQAEFFEYAKALPEYEFHCIGNQAVNFQHYWEPLMRTKPDNLTWWGERNDVDNFYEAADLFLFTSKGNSHDKETMPLVIREAISWKLPTLIYNLGVYQNYFDKYPVEYLIDNKEQNIKNIKNIMEGFEIISEEVPKKEFNIWYDPSEQKIHTIYEGHQNIPEFRIIIRDIDSKATMWKYITPYRSTWCIPVPKNLHDFKVDLNMGGFLVEIFDNTNNTLLFSKNIRVKYPTLYKPSIYSSEEPTFINYNEFFVEQVFKTLPICDFEVVLDIGANVGIWTEWTLQQNAHQVYSFEPNKTALKDLYKLHGENDRVTIIDKAVYKENTELDFFYTDENSLISALHNHNGADYGIPTNSSYKVKAITLEKFIQDYNIAHIDLVKIDIEGGEFDIIPNLKQSSFNIIDNFLIEIHPKYFEDGLQKVQQLKDILYNQGYNINQFREDMIYFSKFKA